VVTFFWNFYPVILFHLIGSSTRFTDACLCYWCALQNLCLLHRGIYSCLDLLCVYLGSFSPPAPRHSCLDSTSPRSFISAFVSSLAVYPMSLGWFWYGRANSLRPPLVHHFFFGSFSFVCSNFANFFYAKLAIYSRRVPVRGILVGGFFDSITGGKCPLETVLWSRAFYIFC